MTLVFHGGRFISIPCTLPAAAACRHSPDGLHFFPMDRNEKNDIYCRRLDRTMELIETIKELSKGKDKSEHPELSEGELETRFWKRCRRLKDREKRP